MARIFKRELHEAFGTWPLAYITTGGLTREEIEAVGREVGDGDDGAFWQAWTGLGDRLDAAAEEALEQGDEPEARALFLKAACAHNAAFHPLYGEPVDPRLTEAFVKQSEAFDRALELFDDPASTLRIPCGPLQLPGCLIPATGLGDETRPLVILTNGYDATMTDMYFASAAAATARGYHCLLFDGPGQGGLLVDHGVRLRPDWETVVAAVVDYALELPGVDPARIALSGWSLGGYLAPRAASGERRLAACVADPGLYSLADGLRASAVELGAGPEAAASLAELDEAVLARMEAAILADPMLKWKIVQRGYWVHGVSTLRDYLREAERYTMAGRAEDIACPTLLTMAEDDPLSAGAQAFFESLRCQRNLLRFTAAEGADGHCEMKNRPLLNERVLDWLDGVMGK